MKNFKIVIGANFGDEGKGLMTDYFCQKAIKNNEKTIVVCANGGAQKGHTVELSNGIKHVFSHFGSGTLAGADTYLAEKFILNPMTFKKEYESLMLIAPNFKVYVSSECLVTTPFEMIANQFIESNRGSNKHGSCGMGIWETILRDKDFMHLTYYSLYNILKVSKDKTIIVDLIKTIRDRYFIGRLKEKGITTFEEPWDSVIFSKTLIENFVADCEFMLNHTILCEDYNILNTYDTVVFECSQGLLLDKDMKGYGKHLTPSKTGVNNPLEIISKLGRENNPIEACYVTRTYLTRHGAGRLDNECYKDAINPKMVDETNIPNPFQDSLRYGKIWGIDLINRIENDYMPHTNKFYIYPTLAVTHLNETNNQLCIDSFTNFEEWEDKYFERVYCSNGKTYESVYKHYNEMINKNTEKNN